MGFHIATAEQIKAGEVVDVYFRRSVDILEARGVDKRVRAEFVAKDLPENWEWAVFAGLEESLHQALPRACGNGSLHLFVCQFGDISHLV